MFDVLPKWVALVFGAVIFLGIVVAYRKHGVTGVAAISSQVIAITVAQLSTKAVINTGFRYPTCIASLHFLSVWCVMLGLEVYQNTWGQRSALIPKSADRLGHGLSLKWYLMRFGPIAVLQCMNVILNNWSLLYLDAGFNALLGIMAPVLTTLVALTFGAEIASLAWVGIVVAVLGDGIVSVEGSKNIVKEGGSLISALLGIGLGVLAMLARCVRSVLMDRQMNKYSSDEACPRLSPLENVRLLSPLVFVLGLALALSVEGITPYLELLTLSRHARSMLLLSAASAVFLTIMGMCVIKMLGASAAQIAGKLNVLGTAAFSSAFLGEHLTHLEILGAIVVICGAGLFEHAQRLSQENASKEDAYVQEACKQTKYMSAA